MNQIRKKNYSLRSLAAQNFNKMIPKKSQCVYLIHKSINVPDTTGSGFDYTDSFYYCNKLERRLHTKRFCSGCKLYNPCNNVKND